MDDSEAPAIVLKAVRYSTSVNSAVYRTVLRRVTAEEWTRADRWAPVLSRLGTPDRFTNPNHHISGTVSEEVEGFKVDTMCGHTSQGYTELLTVLDVGAAGGTLDEVIIDYTSGGKSYTMPHKYTLVACGTAVAETRWCQRSAGD